MAGEATEAITRVPDRGNGIWIDHNPQAGRERKDRHPLGRFDADQLEQVLEIAGQILGFVA